MIQIYIVPGKQYNTVEIELMVFKNGLMITDFQKKAIRIVKGLIITIYIHHS